MSLSVLIDPFASFWNNSGSAFASTIEVYDAGGAALSTIYTTNAGDIESANPLSLTAGRVTIFAKDGTGYKVILKDNAGAVLKTIDNLYTIQNYIKYFDTLADFVADTTLSVGMIAEVLGRYAKGDGGGNTYDVVEANTDTDDDGRWIDLDTLQAKGLFPNGVIDIRQYGAKVDNTTDDTVEINAASTYSNSSRYPLYFPGTSYITDKITFYYGQRIYGTDRDVSGVSVDASFNMAATGIIDVGSFHGCTIHDFGIFCDQDQTESVRANINEYPPAILAQNCPRLLLDRIRIEGSHIGIDMTGNSGGTHITNSEICALTTGVDMNGSLDYVFIDNVEFYSFGIGAGNLFTSVYSDSTTVAMSIVDVDGISIGTVSNFRAKIIIDGATFGTIGCINADSHYSGVEVKGGSWVNISTMYSTNNQDDDWVVKVSGFDTHCGIASLWIQDTSAAGTGLIQVLTSTNCELIISTLWVRITGAGTRIVHQTEGDLRIANGYFKLPVNTVMTSDVFDIDGGRFHINDISTTDKGTGAGNIIGIASDGRHSITNVTAPGWNVSLPASSQQIKTSSNDFVTKTAGTREIVARYTNLYTGSLSGGAATVAHGLTNPHVNYADITAWEITSGAIRTLMTGVTIDATNINLSGGTGTNVYEVVLQVRE